MLPIGEAAIGVGRTRRGEGRAGGRAGVTILIIQRGRGRGAQTPGPRRKDANKRQKKELASVYAPPA